MESPREIPSLPRELEEIEIYNVSLPMLPVSSRNTGNEDYEPELVELLRAMECPVCRGIPNPPIYNCVNGHFSCASCRPRLPLQRCAYCNAKFTKMRNYPLENLVSAPVFLCDFRRAGCKVRDMNMIEYEEHMRKCWYRSLAYPEEQSENNARQSQQPAGSKVLPLNEFSCPRCNFMNSKRKVKCQNCQVRLRVPTPMCSRPPWVSTGNQSTCTSGTESL